MRSSGFEPRGVEGLAGPGRALDAAALRDWAHSAVGDLITHIDEINRLNVFPVADSDTGVNMLFTMRSALAEANTEANSADVVKTAAALSAVHPQRRARQLRGDPVADPARHRRCHRACRCRSGGELYDIDATLLGAALHRGADLVVASMGGREVKGTIVSVLKAASEAVEKSANAGGGYRRRSPPPVMPRWSRWRKPPSNSTCSGRPAWSTPAVAGCWSCLTRELDDHRPGAQSRVYEPAPRLPAPDSPVGLRPHNSK